MEKSALLVIDMQVGMFTALNPPLYQGQDVLSTVSELGSCQLTVRKETFVFNRYEC